MGNSGVGGQEGNQKRMVLKGGKDGTGRKRILSDKILERQERHESISLYSICTKREQGQQIDTSTNPGVFSLLLDLLLRPPIGSSFAPPRFWSLLCLA